MIMDELLYETHVPRYGYTKIWPESWLCPLCNKRGIMRHVAHRPLYIPVNKADVGERVVIYVCMECYKVCHDKRFIDTIESAKECIKCHLELKTHLRTLRIEQKS